MGKSVKMLLHFRRYQVNQYWMQLNLLFARQLSVASITNVKKTTSHIPSERSERIVLYTQTRLDKHNRTSPVKHSSNLHSL